MILIYYKYILDNIGFLGYGPDPFAITTLEYYSETVVGRANRNLSRFPSKVTGNGFNLKHTLRRSDYSNIRKHSRLAEPDLRIKIPLKNRLSSRFVLKNNLNSYKLSVKRLLQGINEVRSLKYNLTTLWRFCHRRKLSRERILRGRKTTEHQYVSHPYFIDFEKDLLNNKWTFAGTPVFNSYLRLFRDRNYGLKLYTSNKINLNKRNRRIYANARRDLKLLRFKQPYKVLQKLLTLTPSLEREIDRDGRLVDTSETEEGRLTNDLINPQYKVLLNPIKHWESRRWLHPEYREERIWTRPYLFFKKKPIISYSSFATLNLLKKASFEIKKNFKSKVTWRLRRRFTRRHFLRVKTEELRSDFTLSINRKKQQFVGYSGTTPGDILSTYKIRGMLHRRRFADCKSFYAYNQFRKKIKKPDNKVALRVKRSRLRAISRRIIRTVRFTRTLRIGRLLVTNYLNTLDTTMKGVLLWKSLSQYSFDKLQFNKGLLDSISRANFLTLEGCTLFAHKINKFRDSLTDHWLETRFRKILHAQVKPANKRGKKSKNGKHRPTFNSIKLFKTYLMTQLHNIPKREVRKKTQLNLFPVHLSTTNSLAGVKRSSYYQSKLVKNLLKSYKSRIISLGKTVKKLITEEPLTPALRIQKDTYNLQTPARATSPKQAFLKWSTEGDTVNNFKKIKKPKTVPTSANIYKRWLNNHNYLDLKKKKTLKSYHLRTKLVLLTRVLKTSYFKLHTKCTKPLLTPSLISTGMGSKQLKQSFIGLGSSNLGSLNTKHVTTLSQLLRVSTLSFSNFQKKILWLRLYKYFKPLHLQLSKKNYAKKEASFEIFKWQLAKSIPSKPVYYKRVRNVGSEDNLELNSFQTFYNKPFFIGRTFTKSGISRFFTKINQYYKWTTSLINNYPRVLQYNLVDSTKQLQFIKTSQSTIYQNLLTSSWYSFKHIIKTGLRTLILPDTALRQWVPNLATRLEFRTTTRLAFVLGAYGFYFKLLWDDKTLFSESNLRKTLLKRFSFVNSVITKKKILRDLTAKRYYYLNNSVLQKHTSTPGFNFYYTTQSLLFKKYSTATDVDLDSLELLLKPLNGATIGTKHAPDRVARIRFKPGYSTMWRRARRDFKVLFFLKFRYQHKLTKYLRRIDMTYEKADQSHLNRNSNTLLVLLMKSKFTTDPFWSYELLNSQSVFINGFTTNNPETVLVKGDFLQLIVHIKYYMVVKWQKNLTILKKSRLYKLAYRKFKPKTQRLGANRNYNYPDWLLNMRFFESDVPAFVELDYFTLSFLVIKSPFQHSYNLNYNEIIGFPLSTRLYNWKYVT